MGKCQRLEVRVNNTRPSFLHSFLKPMLDLDLRTNPGASVSFLSHAVLAGWTPEAVPGLEIHTRGARETFQQLRGVQFFRKTQIRFPAATCSEPHSKLPTTPAPKDPVPSPGFHMRLYSGVMQKDTKISISKKYFFKRCSHQARDSPSPTCPPTSATLLS